MADVKVHIELAPSALTPSGKGVESFRIRGKGESRVLRLYAGSGYVDVAMDARTLACLALAACEAINRNVDLGAG